MSKDVELLQAFIENRSEPAFTQLVQRHLPLVYSAAWRYLGDPHGAQDVAQAVFMLLARKARSVRTHPTLAGWLYTSTYHLATKARRAEIRRVRREQEALAMRTDTPAMEFERLQPFIDDALMKLSEADRTAVLLRYFESRTYADIGAQLGLSENAVRMRIDRGLERVRLSLGKRGVVSTASAIGLAVATRSAGAVPTQLVTTITAACVATPATGGVIFLMSATVLKYTVAAAAVVAGATGVVLQHNEIRRLRSENVRLAAAARPKPATEVAPRSSNAEADRLRAEIVRLKAMPAASWQERAELLRELLTRLPEQNIPELYLATEDDWLTAVRGKLETADDYRRAFAVLRDICVDRFSGMLHAALRKFVAANPGQFPKNVSDLEPYMKQKVAPEIWARYMVAPAAAVANVGVGDMIITPVSVIDPIFEHDYAVGLNGRGSASAGSGVLMSLERAYLKANGKYASAGVPP